MRGGGGWSVGSAAIASLLCMLPAHAAVTEFAQNVPVAGRGAAEQGGSPVAEAPAVLRANSPEQIRKAQTELRRLDCFNGRIDGKLGDQNRQAVKKFWASAKQPGV